MGLKSLIGAYNMRNFDPYEEKFPPTSYSIQVTSDDIFRKINELDRSVVGIDDYFGVAYWWDGSDPFKHSLRESTSWKRKKMHDNLVHNNVPLLSDDRNAEQQALAEEIYRAYL